MKLDTIAPDLSDKIEIAIQKKQQIEKKRVARHLSRIDGGKMWCYNRETKELTEAKFVESPNFFTHEPNQKRIDITPNCVYVEAVNKTNALRRISKGKIVFIS